MREQGDSSMSTLDLQLSLSDDVLVYLKREASKRQISLDVIISEVLADYFNSPTKQEILDDLKLLSWQTCYQHRSDDPFSPNVSNIYNGV